MSNLDKFDPELLDDEQEFEEDEDAVRAAEAELAARDKREGREKVTDQNQAEGRNLQIVVNWRAFMLKSQRHGTSVYFNLWWSNWISLKCGFLQVLALPKKPRDVSDSEEEEEEKEGDGKKQTSLFSFFKRKPKKTEECKSEEPESASLSVSVLKAQADAEVKMPNIWASF